ncbi:hypothetical protein OKA06_09760 [Novosphingobium sp. MW5]|nr:hypothetical protein [Novosphingobium sp. MW5]
MIAIIRISLAACAALSLPSAAEAAVCKPAATLDGNYKANDQGSYQVRTVGTAVWWIGRSADNGASWTNVFKGTRKGNIITGSWADITPDGGSGTLSLRVTQNNQLQKIDSTGSGFGGTIWLRPGCSFSKAVPID